MYVHYMKQAVRCYQQGCVFTLGKMLHAQSHGQTIGRDFEISFADNLQGNNNIILSAGPYHKLKASGPDCTAVDGTIIIIIIWFY